MTPAAPHSSGRRRFLAAAAAAVAAFGAGNGAGKIVMGMVSDRLGGVRAYQLATGIAATSIVALGLAAKFRTAVSKTGVNLAHGARA